MKAMLKRLPRIETVRLILRVPTLDDASRMAAYVLENREHFAPWDPLRSDSYYTAEHWRTALDTVVESAMAGTSLQFILLRKEDEEGKVVGTCTFSNIVRGPFQAAALGYALSHSEVGKGLMKEALEAAIRYSFSELDLHRIMANYMPTNVRSASLLRGLGFVPEGYARDYLFLAGEWQDHVLTAITNDDWSGA